MASCDTRENALIVREQQLMVFRYVDDCLVLHSRGDERETELQGTPTALFTSERGGISSTLESKENRTVRYLDIQI